MALGPCDHGGYQHWTSTLALEWMTAVMTRHLWPNFMILFLADGLVLVASGFFSLIGFLTLHAIYF